MLQDGDRLLIDSGISGMTGEISLSSPDIRLRVSWPSMSFCLFGTDDRVPSCSYTPIFEMALPSWKYYEDVQKFAERNQWMKSYIGCASLEELKLKVSVTTQ